MMQVTKVWWDGERLMAEPIDPTTIYQEPAQKPQRWAVFCQGCRKEWSVSYPHPGKDICVDCDDKLAQQDSTCSNALRAQGKAYPRTCKKCGLGPCVELAQQTLDKKAENARELGLDYEPARDNSNYRYDPPVAEPVAYLCENAVGHKYFRWKKPSSTFKPIALYTTPPAQPAPVQEPVGWMYPDDYERMLTSETFCTVYSVEVGSATRGESSVALYTTPPAAPVKENTMNDEKLLRLALEAIERGVRDGYWNRDTVDVSTAIKKRLLNSTPPTAQRQWVGLTVLEQADCFANTEDATEFYHAIEAKLKEKNT